ncbi:NUDIX hydrolase [Streptomyces spectabilis]|uniref:8-oxo-dGTP diphosphatase n=1 Tax=Streptomyces spectabilis TaxID=68270 RepID=A0A5P2XGT7_STRST|nr:NUDIX domain-containing protein [Streptomyces spectabilis]MBB5102506.1 8-oxo-dGTP diphosphatase [Streptomyces spectabilis]MCI3907546.1 NUDIX domain-containing protein [Streptomyces spectabilis]QEV64237.1 NUDIX domain-containing protein [Streptomyces spectabilis]GGV31453.1 MutT/NUDIX family protein [Streptomyces spectabilis]
MAHIGGAVADGGRDGSDSLRDGPESLAVVAAVIVQEGRLLVVSKKAAPDVFYLPGGKPDAGEEPLEALVRELDEELGVRPVAPTFLAEIESTAALEGVPLHLTVFTAGLSQVPRPAAELARLRWIAGTETDVRLAPAVEEEILPMLRRSGLVPVG